MASLTSYPELVEVPFIMVRVGDFTFGMVDKAGSLPGGLQVDYPNYMKSMSVVKVNGTVNTYNISMEYAITAGDDPNLLDKIFGTISDSRIIYISYGDWASPNYVFKEEEALLTQIKTSANFQNSIISYELICTSACALLAATSFDFPKVKAKVSDVIKDMVTSETFGLKDVFSGMSISNINNNNLIASNDAEVSIEAKTSVSPLTYLSMLVDNMSNANDDKNNPIKSSSYALTIHDDISGDMGGTYFTVTEIPVGNPVEGTSNVVVNDSSDNSTLSTPSVVSSTTTFELDIGYPGENFVTNFSIDSDDSWSILYNYSNKVSQSKWSYSLDDDGHLVTQSGPNLVKAGTVRRVTQESSGWWTKVTQFPINATVTIKGLIRSALLMQYVKVNAYFYGRKHISSGLYIITKQVDNIDSSGYRTTLNLTRISGD